MNNPGESQGEVGGKATRGRRCRRSELPHESQLAVGALVVVELRVGLPLLVHRHQLRAEAE